MAYVKELELGMAEQPTTPRMAIIQSIGLALIVVNIVIVCPNRA